MRNIPPDVVIVTPDGEEVRPYELTEHAQKVHAVTLRTNPPTDAELEALLDHALGIAPILPSLSSNVDHQEPKMNAQSNQISPVDVVADFNAAMEEAVKNTLTTMTWAEIAARGKTLSGDMAEWISNNRHQDAILSVSDAERICYGAHIINTNDVQSLNWFMNGWTVAAQVCVMDAMAFSEKNFDFFASSVFMPGFDARDYEADKIQYVVEQRGVATSTMTEDVHGAVAVKIPKLAVEQLAEFTRDLARTKREMIGVDSSEMMRTLDALLITLDSVLAHAGIPTLLPIKHVDDIHLTHRGTALFRALTILNIPMAAMEMEIAARSNTPEVAQEAQAGLEDLKNGMTYKYVAQAFEADLE